MKDSKLYWLWLSGKCSPNSPFGEILLEYFETPENIYNAGEEEYRECGISADVISRLMDKAMDYAEDVAEHCQRGNIGILTQDDALFPSRLKNIKNPPVLLYYRGKLPDMNDDVMIAAVGTRSCSEYGAKMAYRIGHDLALGGAVTVSGMARGIDGMVHKGTIKAGGHTVAVLGCGVDICYPPEHKRLMHEILESGTVISEFAPKTQPYGANFPIRNRIISGISHGCAVIEADSRSGSLITADYARKQGRDLFAVPGNADEKSARGTNDLIKTGAKIITSAIDILEEYEFSYPFKIFVENIYQSSKRVASNDETVYYTTDKDKKKRVKKEKKASKNEAKEEKTEEIREQGPEIIPPEENTFERVVYDRLKGAKSPDELTYENEDISDILTALTMLEIEGYIKAVPGGKFTKI